MNNIRRIPLCEKTLIVDFMNEHWGSIHPLVNNEQLFNYYYVDGDMTNFYVLEEDEEICAICGYIKCSEDKNSDIWISIWCAKKGKNGLGLTLMGNMKELTKANVISCNNIRENTMPFYNFLGYYPAKMNHYYRLSNLNKYKIATVNEKVIPKSKKIPDVNFEEINDIEHLKNIFNIPSEIKPHKDFWYINKRYFNYPHYQYKIYAIHKNNTVPAIVVFRINENDEGFVLRIVDFIGKPDDIYLLNGFVDELMIKYNCEYCDMYSWGVKGENAGFVLRNADENIIPNYLNPLLQKNIDYFFFTSEKENFMMFKADGDQDRKNLG